MAGGQLNGKAWKENYRPQRMTAAEFNTLQAMPAPKANKYGAVPVNDPEHGFFHSQHEHRRFHILRLMERAGQIKDLKRQVPYLLVINGVVVGKIVMDFVYMERTGRLLTGGEPEWVHVDDDAKGDQTPLSKFQHKVFAAIFGREIRIS